MHKRYPAARARTRRPSHRPKANFGRPVVVMQGAMMSGFVGHLTRSWEQRL